MSFEISKAYFSMIWAHCFVSPVQMCLTWRNRYIKYVFNLGLMHFKNKHVWT